MEKNIDFGCVADIYDYYTNVDFDIEFYKKLCEGHTKILELMCGTGRVSIPLINKGYPLTCVDYSEEMLGVFRSKIGKSEETNEPENVKIVCQDVCELDLEEQFDLIIIPSNSISEITNSNKRRQAFKKIYEHLTPNGIFFCSLYNPEYRKQMADGSLRYLGKYKTADEKTLVVTYYNVYSGINNMITGTQFYEIYDSNNRLTEKRLLDIRFSVITKEDICKTARDAGFSLKGAYGDYEPNHYDENSMFMNLIFMKRKRKCKRSR